MKRLVVVFMLFIMALGLTGCELFDIALPEPCDSGYERIDGECVLIETEECLDTEVMINDECQEKVKCTSDETYKEDTNTCEEIPITCDDGEVLNTDTNECEPEVIVCEDGKVLNQETNVCEEPLFTCIEGFVLIGDECFLIDALCDDGFEYIDGVCYEIVVCPEPYQLEEDECILPTITGPDEDRAAMISQAYGDSVLRILFTYGEEEYHVNGVIVDRIDKTYYIITEGSGMLDADGYEVVLSDANVEAQFKGYDMYTGLMMLEFEYGGFLPVVEIDRDVTYSIGDPIVSFSANDDNVEDNMFWIYEDYQWTWGVADYFYYGEGYILTTDNIIDEEYGGAIFDMDGNFLGLDVYWDEAEYGYVIPFEEIYEVLPYLYDNQPTLKFGLYFDSAYSIENMLVYPDDYDMTPPSGIEAGVYLTQTYSGDIFGNAGVQSGDVIVRINGFDVFHYGDMKFALYYKFSHQDDISIEVYRDGGFLTLTTKYSDYTYDMYYYKETIDTNGSLRYGEYYGDQMHGYHYVENHLGESWDEYYSYGVQDGYQYYYKPNGETIGWYYDNGVLDDNAYYWFTNDDYYWGPIHDNIPKGQGYYYHSDGRVYWGLISHNIFWGESEGAIWYANGDYYEGTVSNGVASGEGAIWYENGDYYEGTFANDSPALYGTFWYADGAIFEGYLNDDGTLYYGTYWFPDASPYFSYVGSFENNMPSSSGRLTWDNGVYLVAAFNGWDNTTNGTYYQYEGDPGTPRNLVNGVLQ